MYFEEPDFNILYKKLVIFVLKNGRDVIVRNLKTKECTNILLTLTDVNNDFIDFTKSGDSEQQKHYDRQIYV